MSDIDSLIPFLQQLVQRMRITPPANEIALLQKATFKEMRPYFDAQSSGRQDTEVYAMILKYLANPSGGTGLNEPASPPKAAPQQPAPQQAAPVTLSKPSDPKTQVRTIMPGVELHVTEKDGPRWTFEIATKGTNDLTTVTFDFSASMNISLTPEGPSKSTGPLTMTVNVPTTANTGGKELRALIATAAGTGNNVSLNYKLALRGGGGGGAGGSGGNSGSSTTTTTTTRTNQSAPQPEPEEEDVVTKVADGLSVIVQSVETGYKLLAENVHATNSYAVTLDLGESVNLTFAAKGPGQLVDPTKVSFTLPAKLGKCVQSVFISILCSTGT